MFSCKLPKKFVLLPALAVSVLTFAGCGPSYVKTVKVEGTIKYKGETVDGAKIMFSPIDEKNGLPAYGVSDASGKYVIQTMDGKIGEGTTPGEYKVTVSKSVDVPTGKTRPKPEGGTEPILEGKEFLPKIYKFNSNTPLKETVEAGKINVIDFDLK